MYEEIRWILAPIVYIPDNIPEYTAAWGLFVVTETFLRLVYPGAVK
jgi:hypothetical protein